MTNTKMKRTSTSDFTGSTMTLSTGTMRMWERGDVLDFALVCCGSGVVGVGKGEWMGVKTLVRGTKI